MLAEVGELSKRLLKDRSWIESAVVGRPALDFGGVVSEHLDLQEDVLHLERERREILHFAEGGTVEVVDTAAATDDVLGPVILDILDRRLLREHVREVRLQVRVDRHGGCG